MKIEEPQIIVGVPETMLDPITAESASEEYLRRLHDDIIRVELADTSTFENTSIGRGADGLALIALLVYAFFQGKRIEENIEAWIKIANRVTRGIDRLRTARAERIYVSESLAISIATARIQNEYDVEIEGISARQTVPVRGYVQLHYEGEFRYNPERTYVFVLEANCNRQFLIVIKSTGEILHKMELPTESF